MLLYFSMGEHSFPYDSHSSKHKPELGHCLVSRFPPSGQLRRGCLEKQIIFLKRMSDFWTMPCCIGLLYRHCEVHVSCCRSQKKPVLNESFKTFMSWDTELRGAGEVMMGRLMSLSSITPLHFIIRKLWRDRHSRRARGSGSRWRHSNSNIFLFSIFV